jgi:uncharacterized protein with von Willebrand factor type A (vWA) domain
MNPLMVIQILEALAQLAPAIPQVINGVETAIQLLHSGQAPTPEQQASIDALLDHAHSTFQS